MIQLFRRLFKRRCDHESVVTDVKREPNGHVSCPGLKCGEILTAEYGVVLPTSWVSVEQAAAWRKNVELYEQVEKERARIRAQIAKDCGRRP